ncbi:hypothetical protein [Thermococcus sp. JCM 11816]|uniref:hypothetical protein n=1 Tax=Thermococcus sp. (strain JCM 11816 / KS-1) TaxID=1295125 RepID=UPI00346673A4
MNYWLEKGGRTAGGSTLPTAFHQGSGGKFEKGFRTMHTCSVKLWTTRGSTSSTSSTAL